MILHVFYQGLFRTFFTFLQSWLLDQPVQSLSTIPKIYNSNFKDNIAIIYARRDFSFGKKVGFFKVLNVDIIGWCHNFYSQI